MPASTSSRWSPPTFGPAGTKSRTSARSPTIPWTTRGSAPPRRAPLSAVRPIAASSSGGSGQGEAISANKVRGARAALCHDETTARLARLHNDANVLSLGARILGPELALAIVDVFFSTEFEGGRHVERLAEVAAIEAEEHDRP